VQHLRSAVLAVTLVALAAPASAQHSKIFGVKAGVSVAGLTDLDDTFDDENTTGFAAGLFYTFGQGIFALQPELNFTNKGIDVTGVEEINADLLYMQPAIVLKVGLPLAVLRPSLFGGVGYGFLLSCDAGEGIDCDEDLDPQDEFSGILGIDLEFWLGAFAIVADARYELGFNEITDAPGDIIDDPRSRSWILRAGLGYRH